MRAVWGALCLHQTYLMHTLKPSLVTPETINTGRKLQTATTCSIPYDKVGNLEKLKYAVASENSMSSNSDDSCDSGIVSDADDPTPLSQKNTPNAEKLQQSISRFKERLFNCRFKRRCHRCKASGHTRSKCTKI